MLAPKYKLNQIVYTVCQVDDYENRHVECDVCNSTGTVHIDGKGDYNCPKCRGDTRKICIGRKFRKRSSGHVGKIQTEEYASKYKHRWDCKSNIRYMIDSTGVGSGTFYYENEVFPSEEEADDFCKNFVPDENGNPTPKYPMATLANDSSEALKQLFDKPVSCDCIKETELFLRETLGVEVKDEEGNMKTIGRVIDELSDKWNRIGLENAASTSEHDNDVVQ